ncbi:glyoxalase [Kosakonia radicincitans UMEnt01/12]|uniref:VOC family protein n=1 Tax=Kosakonia radicincitans TaxID=283686 RepID=UPI000461A4F4|nr:VOC family protein [Kosakonia radicincitans]KDE33176.1 glyoxalase [Kosakonia radicincitans UMEnt01/12]
MIDHLSIPVFDFERSKRFYIAALKPLGYSILKDSGVAAGFGVMDGHGKPLDPGGDFWIFQGDVSNRPATHFSFSAENRKIVDEFYMSALQAGGVDNGGPGLRTNYHPHYYAAFIYDPDGYNIEAVCHAAS